MKNYVKAIVTFVFMMAAVAVMPSVADAAVAPGNLRQTDASTGSVTFTWDAVPNADDYYTSWSADGVTWSNGDAVWYGVDDTISGLNAGRSYFVRVCTEEDDVKSEWSAPFEVVTAPDYSIMGDPIKTAATTNSLAFQWNAATGATSYNVYDYGTDILLGTTTQTSFVWNGLVANQGYRLKVVPVRTSTTGYMATGGTWAWEVSSTTYTKPNTPVTPSTSNFGLDSVYYNINVAYFGAQDPSRSANGYEIEVINMKTKKKVFTATSSNYRFSVKRNVPYKYRCRFYATYENEKIYGGWSGYRYFTYQTVSGKKYSNRIKMSWKKVSAAKSYTVYISTSEKGGYKKVKKVGKKTTSLTIRKCGKKRIKRNGKYYVKVVANLKDGKKSVKSDVYYVGHTY